MAASRSTLASAFLTPLVVGGLALAALLPLVSPATAPAAEGTEPPGPAASVTISLHGRVLAPAGWGFTNTSVTSPGPTVRVNEGDSVTMRLFSADTVPHDFLLDYDGSGNPTLGEPQTTSFSSDVTPLIYTFTASRAGTFTYWCFIHRGPMFGTWVTNARPTVTFTAPTAGRSWTGGSTQDVVFDVSDDQSLAGARMWVNYTSAAQSGPIAGPSTPSATNTIPWTVPQIDATDVRINVTVIDALGATRYAESAAFEIDSTPPAISDRMPGIGETGVPLNAQVAVTFSEGMDRTATESSAAFGVQRVMDGAWIAGTRGWSADSRTLTFTPAGGLAPLTSYQVHVNTSARDDSEPGNGLLAPSVWQFVTSSAADAVPPTIGAVAASPSPQAEGGHVNITATVADNVAVASVVVRVVGPGLDTNLTMARGAGSVYYANRTYADVGRYTFTISATDTSGNGATRTGTFDIADITAPPSPLATDAAVLPSGAVRVTWAEVTAADLAGYHVYRAQFAETTFTRLTTAPVPASGAREYVDVTVQAGRTYKYVVTSVDTSGNESPFSPEAVVTIPAVVDQAPADVLIVASVVLVAIVIGAVGFLLLRRSKKP